MEKGRLLPRVLRYLSHCIFLHVIDSPCEALDSYKPYLKQDAIYDWGQERGDLFVALVILLAIKIPNNVKQYITSSIFFCRLSSSAWYLASKVLTICSTSLRREFKASVWLILDCDVDLVPFMCEGLLSVSLV